MNNKKTMYDLKLNEDLDISGNFYADKTRIIRVPGGWIYYFYEECGDTGRPCCCFVPYNNEFMYEIKP